MRWLTSDFFIFLPVHCVAESFSLILGPDRLVVVLPAKTTDGNLRGICGYFDTVQIDDGSRRKSRYRDGDLQWNHFGKSLGGALDRFASRAAIKAAQLSLLRRITDHNQPFGSPAPASKQPTNSPTTLQTKRSSRTVKVAILSVRGANPIPDLAGTRIVPCALTVTSGEITSSCQ